MAGVTVRPGKLEDLERIRAIQDLSPEAAHWNPEEYLAYDLAVACCGEQVVGFLVIRAIAYDECEILNVAVHPDFRRRGIARKLIEWCWHRCPGEVFLEVRESNAAARYFYESMGFTDIGHRPEYYSNPPEGAVVMKFHSCYRLGRAK